MDPVSGSMDRFIVAATRNQIDGVNRIVGRFLEEMDRALGGQIHFAAMYPNEYFFPVNMADIFYHKEITMTGQLMSPYAFPRANRLLPYIDLDALIGKSFYIDDAAEAFDAHMTGKYPKVLICCNKDLEFA